MTEEEWFACADPRLMLEFVRGSASDRKVRPFAAACFRRDWTLLADERSRKAIIVCERFADGQATTEQLDLAHVAALDAAREIKRVAFDPLGTWRTNEEADECHRRVGYSLGSSDTAWGAAMGATSRRTYQSSEAAVEGSIEASLVRHIIGNPFQPYAASAPCSSSAVELATALYDGQDCGFALHDALLEAGRPELADHFCREQIHPKGCWVMDLLLGKE